MSLVRTLRTATSSLSRTLAARPTLRTTAFSQTRTMASTSNFLEAIKKRRTYYAISNKSSVSDARIEEIVKDIVLHVPSSFNSQSSRVVVLFKAEHEKLWDITSEVLKPVVPEAQWPTTEKKLGSFKAGYGTILFFEDQVPVRELQKNFALYQDKFPVWSEVRAPALPHCPCADVHPSPAHQRHDPVRHLDGARAGGPRCLAAGEPRTTLAPRDAALTHPRSTTTRSSTRRSSRRGTSPRPGTSSLSCPSASPQAPRARRPSSRSRSASRCTAREPRCLWTQSEMYASYIV